MTEERTIQGAANHLLQVRRQRPRLFDQAKRRTFLNTLAATCNVKLSAREAGIPPARAYQVRARDEAFAEAWAQALQIGYARLEEALLGYAIAQVEAAGIDPDAVDPAAIPGTIQADMARGTVSKVGIDLALSLLARHRAMVEGRGYTNRNGGRASRAELDAALNRKLDSLAQRMREA